MTDHSKIPEIINKISYQIGEKYNTIFSQCSDIGDSREKHLINFMQKVFPTKYGFSSGEIFDKNGLECGQVDIIIYDYIHSLVFTDGSGKILSPVESTYGIFEVKSTLTTSTLKDSLNKINSYANLNRPEVPDNTFIISPDKKLKAGYDLKFDMNSKNIPFNCIFAYKNEVKKETIYNMIKDNANIDLLIIPNKFVFFGRSRKDFFLTNNNKNLEYYCIEDNNAIGIGILYMMNILSSINLIGLQKEHVFLKYINTFNVQIFNN